MPDVCMRAANLPVLDNLCGELTGQIGQAGNIYQITLLWRIQVVKWLVRGIGMLSVLTVFLSGGLYLIYRTQASNSSVSQYDWFMGTYLILGISMILVCYDLLKHHL